jgi:acyl-CoA dehydrogenase
MDSFLGSAQDEVPIELLPHKHRLTPRFFQVKKNLQEFLMEVILPRRSEYSQKFAELKAKETDPLRAPQPLMLKELQDEAKKRGLFNLFLPEVSGLSVVSRTILGNLLSKAKLRPH